MMEEVLYVICNEEESRFYRGEIQRATYSPIFAEKYISEEGAEFVRKEVMTIPARAYYTKILPVKFTATLLREEESESTT